MTGGRDAAGPAEALDAREPLTHWEGEPLPVLARLWGVPRLEAYGSVGSTNDVAAHLARRGAPEGTVVIAEEQTAGRGRSGHRWESPSGQGLWMSVLLRPGPSGGAPLLTVALGVCAALAVEEALGGEGAGRVTLEWPNDVLVGGRKVCGILCEGAGGPGAAAVVAGIGLNVRQRPEDFPPGLRETATSLEAAAGGPVNRAGVAGGIIRRTSRLLVPAPPSLEGELARHLRRLDGLRGRRVRAEGGAEGEAAGIAPDGALRIRDAAGAERRIIAGSVRVVDGNEEEP